MKLLTLTLLTCARKACKPLPDAYPLQPVACELEVVETELNLLFLVNILPRVEWDVLRKLGVELGVLPGGEGAVGGERPEGKALVEGGDGGNGGGGGGDGEHEEGEVQITESDRPSALARELHRLLMETCVKEGRLRCRACGHEYAVKEGIANFLLPAHLV